MHITHLKLRNWRNFREVDAPLHERTYLLGPNASGKSNLLDVFRFLRDISKARGGGLLKAIEDRGGLGKLRCLHARTNPRVEIEVALGTGGGERPDWRYRLAFMKESRGQRRTLVAAEEIWKGDKQIVERPTKDDEADPDRLTQTYLEQIQMNAEFRDLAKFLSNTTYLHLVPQLLKYDDIISSQQLEDDPFGQGFLQRLAKLPEKTRNSRLKTIEKALSLAVPQFKELRFVQDPVSGRPHLEAQYAHHRPRAGWQREEQFSDGTLRLIGLLWSLLENDSLLLLEEPELSLNDAIVKEIPRIFQRVQRNSKSRRQLIISTHSEALLSNKGIDGRGVLMLEPGPEGTSVRPPNGDETLALEHGLSVAEVMLPKTKPERMGQMELL